MNVFRDICNSCGEVRGEQHANHCAWNGEVGAWSGITPLDPNEPTKAELQAALDKPLWETILAVLTTMPKEADPEHLAKMIESQVRAWQAIDLPGGRDIEGEIREHVQPLIDAFQVDERIRRRYRNGH